MRCVELLLFYLLISDASMPSADEAKYKVRRQNHNEYICIRNVLFMAPRIITIMLILGAMNNTFYKMIVKTASS